LIIPNIMLRRGRTWNGGYKFIVRLGAAANKRREAARGF
jgi:hypothetical protein